MSSAALRLDLPSDTEASVTERIGAATFVLALRARGVFDTAVLRAMETVRREIFAPRRFADLARTDVALPIACGQTMTAPSHVAVMLAALGVAPGHRILEVGTGSGYVTALLARVGAQVRSIERLGILAESARAKLAVAGFGDGVEVIQDDGLAGDASDRRYDRILVNGALATIPGELTSRLAAGGRLVGAVAGGGPARLCVLSRDADGRLSQSVSQPLRIASLTARQTPDSRPAATEL